MFILAIGPAAAAPTQDFFYADLYPGGTFNGGGGTGYPSTDPTQDQGLWYDTVFPDTYTQWFYDHPTVYDYYKIIEYSFTILPHDFDAYAEIWISWSTPEWSPNPVAPPINPGDDIFINRELVFTYTYHEPEDITDIVFHFDPATLIIPDYNPEWIAIDILGQDFYIQGEIWHECLPQESTVPIPGAVWLLGSGLLGLIGFRKKSIG